MCAHPHQTRSRRPLSPGNRYAFYGYPRNGFRITSVCLPGHPDNDGGLPGVGVQWLQPGNRSRWFYPCATEAEFWADYRFANACDPEAANAGKSNVNNQMPQTSRAHSAGIDR